MAPSSRLAEEGAREAEVPVAARVPRPWALLTRSRWGILHDFSHSKNFKRGVFPDPSYWKGLETVARPGVMRIQILEWKQGLWGGGGSSQGGVCGQAGDLSPSEDRTSETRALQDHIP